MLSWKGLCRVAPEQNLLALEDELKQLNPAELHDFALTGRSPLPVLARPLPNLLFMRDVGAVVGHHVILSHPATAARARESVILDVVLRYHPGFAAHRDRLIKLTPGVTFEGGDLLVASPRVVLIGHSERTSFGGVMAVTQALFEQTSVEHVLMVDLPKRRSCMHLDTVFHVRRPGRVRRLPTACRERGDWGGWCATPEAIRRAGSRRKLCPASSTP